MWENHARQKLFGQPHVPSPPLAHGFLGTQIPPTFHQSNPTTYSLNGFGNFGSKTAHRCRNQGGHRSQTPARDYRRDIKSPFHRSRLRALPPIVRSRIQTMGPIVPASPLPHRLLHSDRYDQMAQDVPCPEGESRSLRQGPTLLGQVVRGFSWSISQIHPVVHKRGEDVFVRVWEP